MMSNSVQRFGWIETLEMQTQTLLGDIQKLSDGELIEKYKQMNRIGHSVWIMECALAAEMLRRAVDRRKDPDEESGKVAAARKLAAQLDVTPRRIFESAKIHQEFFEEDESAGARTFAESAKDLEKTFFQIALEADDPKSAITRFVEAKKENPDFSTRDAKRMLATEDAPPLDDVIWGGMDAQKQGIWSEYQRAISGMKYHFPSLRLTLADHLEDLKEQLKLISTTTIREAILKLVAEGLSTKEEISNALGKPREYVSVWLDRMVEAKELTGRPAERKEDARGAVKMLYFLPKNKRTPQVH